MQKILALSVHLFTSTGIVAGFMAMLAITEGNFRMAMIWLFVALVIDGIDGTFARYFRVKEVLPHFDGKTIDYVVDFATYAIIPAFFLYMAEKDGVYLFPEDMRLWAAVIILLVSAMYYGREGMVTRDFYFVGFPVLWNVVAYYLFFVMDASPWWNFFWIVVMGILHFVPLKFLYPSRTTKFKWMNWIMSTLFVVSCTLLVWQFPETHPVLKWCAWICVTYFSGLSIYHTYFDADTKNI